jgi:hypothetical protein
MTCDAYDKTCKERFDKLDNSNEQILKCLYVGNGHPPINVQIDRLNTFKRIAIGLFVPIYIAAIGLLVKGIAAAIAAANAAAQ